MSNIAPSPGRDTALMRRRLRRAAGQVAGIERMLAEEQPCDQVLVQLAAAQGALRAVAQQVFGCYVKHELASVDEETEEMVSERITALAGLLASASSPYRRAAAAHIKEAS